MDFKDLRTAVRVLANAERSGRNNRRVESFQIGKECVVANPKFPKGSLHPMLKQFVRYLFLAD
jgi:AMMECR1 domain-containing protein